MTDPETLKIFPTRQVKPYDGMPVTADTWAQAHAEHRQARQAHDLIFHGSGIVTGLEVIANDPPSQLVFISPGVAVDPTGKVIVLPEPVAYDFGNTSEGVLYLVLGRGEREVGGGDKEIITIQDEFVIAARPTMPKRPVVELARVVISRTGNVVKNAVDPLHPTGEELDLRFRNMLRPQMKQRVKVALINLGGETPGVVSGWDHLSQECERVMSYTLVVDIHESPSSKLQAYDLIYLSGKGTLKLEADRLKTLRTALDAGSLLILEALDAPAEKSFHTIVEKMGLSLTPVEAQHSLLSSPFLFNCPPTGALGDNVQVGEQVIFSTAGYSLAWGGMFASGQTSRTDIRNAHEWGINLIHYCVQRLAGRTMLG